MQEYTKESSATQNCVIQQHTAIFPRLPCKSRGFPRGATSGMTQIGSPKFEMQLHEPIDGIHRQWLCIIICYLVSNRLLQNISLKLVHFSIHHFNEKFLMIVFGTFLVWRYTLIWHDLTFSLEDYHKPLPLCIVQLHPIRVYGTFCLVCWGGGCGWWVSCSGV